MRGKDTKVALFCNMRLCLTTCQGSDPLSKIGLCVLAMGTTIWDEVNRELQEDSAGKQKAERLRLLEAWEPRGQEARRSRRF